MHNSELYVATKQTRFVRNPYRGGGFHPDFVPVRFVPRRDSYEAIELFIEQIDDLNESDYGDFMRAANLYLTDLVASLGKQNRKIRNKLRKMQTYTQFYPNWDVELTRGQILADAEECRLNLGEP